MRSLRLIVLVSLACFVVGGVAYAQDVTEGMGKATVNWTKKEVVFSGEGAVNLQAPNKAAARIGAERAALLEALRNALEAMKGVRIKAGTTVDDQLKATPEMRAEVEGIVQGFLVQETHYYSDGGVKRDLRIPLDGILGQTLLKGQLPPPAPVPAVAPAPAPAQAPAPAAPAPAPKASEGTKPAQTAVASNTPAPTQAPAPAANTAVTGVVFRAKGFKVIPVLAPKVVDENGNEVYGVASVTDAKLERGIASYMKDETAAMAEQKVAGNPLLISALKSPNSVDLVISNKDADTLRQVAKLSPALSQGRVIIVKD